MVEEVWGFANLYQNNKFKLIETESFLIGVLQRPNVGHWGDLCVIFRALAYEKFFMFVE